jgi:hypothetical protein
MTSIAGGGGERRVGTGFLPLAVFTFLNSIGTGVVTNGIYFLTDHGFGFSRAANFGLGLALGITYIVGATGAPPLMRRLRDVAGLSARGLLGWLMALMAILCALPAMAYGLDGPGPADTPWAIWIMVGLYSPLSGVLWPLVESFVSGGRSGHELRSTIGVFNIVWSSAIIAGYWLIAPMTKKDPVVALVLLGSVHVFAGVLLASFSREPYPHIHEEHEPHPRVFEQLLIVFRLLLPMSYVALSTIGPHLPNVAGKLLSDTEWQTRMVTAWLLPRVLGFWILARWGGWHGKWWAAVVGAVLLIAGFAGAVLGTAFSAPGSEGVAPAHADAVAWIATLGGLACFGLGMAMVYSGALYYAMEVGKAEVDAGGKHEALIGVGYTFGPGIGLAASAAAGAGWVDEAGFSRIVLGAVSLVVLGVTGMAFWRISREGRREAAAG